MPEIARHEADRARVGADDPRRLAERHHAVGLIVHDEQARGPWKRMPQRRETRERIVDAREVAARESLAKLGRCPVIEAHLLLELGEQKVGVGGSCDGDHAVDGDALRGREERRQDRRTSDR